MSILRMREQCINISLTIKRSRKLTQEPKMQKIYRIQKRYPLTHRGRHHIHSLDVIEAIFFAHMHLVEMIARIILQKIPSRKLPSKYPNNIGQKTLDHLLRETRRRDETDTDGRRYTQDSCDTQCECRPLKLQNECVFIRTRLAMYLPLDSHTNNIPIKHITNTTDTLREES